MVCSKGCLNTKILPVLSYYNAGNAKNNSLICFLPLRIEARIWLDSAYRLNLQCSIKVSNLLYLRPACCSRCYASWRSLGIRQTKTTPQNKLPSDFFFLLVTPPRLNHSFPPTQACPFLSPSECLSAKCCDFRGEAMPSLSPNKHRRLTAPQENPPLSQPPESSTSHKSDTMPAQ